MAVETNGRNRRGQFTAGNKIGTGGSRPGAGRKPKIVELGLKELLDEVLTTERRKRLLRVAADMAEQGSAKHLDFLFNYAYGRPTERIIHAGDAEQPMAIVLRWARGIDNEPGPHD